MIKSIDEGLLITQVAGLHSGVNPVSGDFSLAAKGFIVKPFKEDTILKALEKF